MNRKSMRLITACITFGAILLGVGPSAMGQTPSSEHEVKVEASKVVSMRHNGVGTNIPYETVQLSRQVNFSDLNLTSESGRSELHRRISMAATTICEQLERLRPRGSIRHGKMDRAACVEGAVSQAMEAAMPSTESAHGSENESEQHESENGSQPQSEPEHEPEDE